MKILVLSLLLCACATAGDLSAFELKPTDTVKKLHSVCKCGFTTKARKVTCHKCMAKSTIESGKQIATPTESGKQISSPTDKLVAPGGPKELDYCCDTCGVGTGQGCETTTIDNPSFCGANRCFVSCACGETFGGGGLACHGC